MSNNCTPNIQARLSAMSRLGMAAPSSGALALAFSPQNGAEVQAQMVQKNGKNSVYSITYVNANCAAVDTCATNDCSQSATDSGSLTTCTTFNSFDCYASHWEKIGISTLRDLGSETVTNAFAARLWGQMNKIKDKIDIALVAALSTGAGYVQDGAATRLLKLIDANGAPIFTVDTEILADMGDAGFSGVTPLLLGNRIVTKFAKGQLAGGLNNAGVNLGAQNRFPVFYDNNVNATNAAPDTAGNDVMFSVLPGLVNTLTWSENAGIFASRNTPQRWDAVDPTSLIMEGSSFMHTVIEDPNTGMLFDLNVVYEPKCKDWSYQIKCYYKNLILPVTGCSFTSFNGITKYDVCPDVAIACA